MTEPTAADLINALIYDFTHIDPVAYQAMWDELDRIFAEENE